MLAMVKTKTNPTTEVLLDQVPLGAPLAAFQEISCTGELKGTSKNPAVNTKISRGWPPPFHLAHERFAGEPGLLSPASDGAPKRAGGREPGSKFGDGGGNVLQGGSRLGGGESLDGLQSLVAMVTAQVHR